MAHPIKAEPARRLDGSPHRRPLTRADAVLLPRPIRRPDVRFFDVLESRTSCLGGSLSDEDLSTLLWHSTALRRREVRRFACEWESRPSPSAGGLHSIQLLVLPLTSGMAGTYDPDRHALSAIDARTFDANRESIGKILGAAQGTTIQFVADRELMAACYTNWETLLWRDAGALLATMCLVASALDLTATPVGRVGDAIVQAAQLPAGFVGAGAVHVGR